MDAKTQEVIDQRLTLYRSLFRGREDVYAYRWTNQKGESGYSPAREKNDGQEERPYLPLTERIIRAHLGGRTTIGVYPLLPDLTTWILAVDLDGEHGDPLADAQRLIAYCKDWGIPAYLERSRSGAGVHVWTFFSAPVPAWKVRLVALRVLLPEAGIQMDAQAAFDRLFPNQDRHSGKGLGNLIALPLQGERLKHGCTAFLDTSNGLNPYPSQWSFLETIQRTDESKLDEILKEFSLSEQDASQTSRKAAPPPEQVRERLAGGFAMGQGRNEACFTVARKLAAQGMPQEEAQAFMTAWNQSNRPPLDTEELKRTVESAFQRAAKNGKSFSSPIRDGEEENKISLRPRGAADLIQNSPEVAWLVDGILPVGRSLMLTGDAGSGKSWAALDLALSVDQGRPWLGRFPTRQGRVIVCDEENGDPTVRQRLTQALRGEGQPEDGSACGVQFLSMAGLDLSDEAIVGAMDAVLSGEHYDLLIIDTLSSCHHQDENDASAMRPVLDVLKQWMSCYGTGICLLHHRRKPGAGGDDGQHAYRGSSALKAFVDGHLDLTPVKDAKGCANIRHVKARVRGPVDPFGIEVVDLPTGGTVVRATEHQKSDVQTKLEEIQEFILSIADSGEWVPRQDIKKRGGEAGYSEKAIDTARDLLLEVGRLEEKKEGNKKFYRIPPKSLSSSHTPIGGRQRDEDEDRVIDGPWKAPAEEEVSI